MPGPQPRHLPPCILCIVGRGLDRLTAHNERRQPAKLARSCGCLPCRGKHCSLPDFAPLNRGPTLTTPHLRGASGTPPPYNTIRRASHYRKRPRRPGGRPPYIPLYHIPWGGPSPATRSRHPVGAGHARPATLPLPPCILCIVGRGLDPSAGRRGHRPLQQSAGLLITANVRGGLWAGRPTSHFTTFRGAGLRPQLIHATL